MIRLITWYLFCCLFLTMPVARAEQDSFDSLVTEALSDKIGDASLHIEPSYSSGSKLAEIKNKQEQIKSISLEKFEPTHSSFRIKIEYNNGTYDSISGKYILFAEMPVAARLIKVGEIVQASDLSSVKARLDSIKKGFVVDEKQIVGMLAKKHIPAGTMFRSQDIASPPVVKVNDPVNIVYSSGAINLKTTGIAMGNGAVGDMIKVKNESSGVVVLGQIINKNTVQVGGE